MELKNIKHKSGYLINSKSGSDIYKSDSGVTITFPNKDKSALVPVKDDYESEYQELTLNLSDVYNDVFEKVISIKDNKTNHVESIISLANNWGFLRKAPNMFDDSLFENDDMYHEYQNKSKFDRFNGEEEYKYWKLLLDKIIPASQSFLENYLKQNNNQPTISDFNSCLDRGITISYKSLKRTSYEVTPINLLSALTIFSKSRKERRKKQAVIICSYSKCEKEILQNIGIGRGRTTCSDSCRQLKYRENKKK